MIDAIQRLMEHDTAGDPITGLKWTRKTTRKVCRELRTMGIDISRNTVARILREFGFSLRVNRKELARKNCPGRDRQFRYIKSLREGFLAERLPIVSVDTKKKELVGLFKNPGAVWARNPTLVNDHDFRSDAIGIAVPYGIFDASGNRGHLIVGTSHDTPAFAVDSLVDWWRTKGRFRYPDADHLLILADNGGSNGSRCHAWKYNLQARFCDRFGLAVTVAHYPSGASKWNPIEHRLFSEISKNWAGQPLESFDTIVNYARTTKTETGLSVTARLSTQTYATGVRIAPEQMASLNIHPHDSTTNWNYSIFPRSRNVRS